MDDYIVYHLTYLGIGAAAGFGLGCVMLVLDTCRTSLWRIFKQVTS